MKHVDRSPILDGKVGHVFAGALFRARLKSIKGYLVAYETETSGTKGKSARSAAVDIDPGGK
ncbi:MAG: hypothetical protein GKR97_07105 [Rhizobiaceae bacterium]|nr:hypothetical protein [Rhizobiaceae bacterium]